MMARQVSAGGVFKAVVHALFKSARQTFCMIGLGVCLLPGAYAQEADFGLNLDVQQKDSTFVTRASFTLPLKYCQAWQFLVDYDSARNIPGFVESKSQRLADNKVRVDRVLQDRILFVPIKMRSVIDFTELPLRRVPTTPVLPRPRVTSSPHSVSLAATMSDVRVS